MITYKKYSEFLKEKYGVKVYKLPINIYTSCPNRDGSVGVGGCTYCAEVGAGFESLPASFSVEEQIIQNKQKIQKKYKPEKFIAYFQNYSNTYMPVEQLRKYITSALQEDIVEISISTRPDCISDEILQTIHQIQQTSGVNISIELGIQSVNYKSLIKINRGHTLAEFIDAMYRIKKYNFEVCVHIIPNLPTDDIIDVIETAKIISVLNVDRVKIHALYILKGTKMAEDYPNLNLISKEEYQERVITFLEYLSPHIAIERLIGRAPEENSIFVNWSESWWKIRDEIEHIMIEHNRYQGKYFDYTNGAAFLDC